MGHQREVTCWATQLHTVEVGPSHGYKLGFWMSSPFLGPSASLASMCYRLGPSMRDSSMFMSHGLSHICPQSVRTSIHLHIDTCAHMSTHVYTHTNTHICFLFGIFEQTIPLHFCWPGTHYAAQIGLKPMLIPLPQPLGAEIIGVPQHSQPQRSSMRDHCPVKPGLSESKMAAPWQALG